MKSLWEELVNYSASDYYPFHMPGHKRFPEKSVLPCCKRLPKNEEDALTGNKKKESIEELYKYDITEIEGFDNLHDAKGLLLALQQKAARIYHAEQSFFLINGSTGGILSAVSAVAQDGKKLLVARNCHKSVYNGLALNRLQAEYLWPEMVEEFDIQGEITAKQVKEYLAGREDFCGVVITSPTYDGIVSDIREIAGEVHACNIPLIVDEAHGAHFVLSDKAPESAVKCGADIVINSVHKTLPALTQTALLHVQGELVDREKLKVCLSMYQSSSPSYLFMASIDHCVDFIAGQGGESYERLLMLRKHIDEGAEGFSHIRILPAGKSRDPGKLVISVKGTEITGRELYQILLKQYHIQMEMAAPTYVLGILTVMDTGEGVVRLISALKDIDRKISEREEKSTNDKLAERKEKRADQKPAEGEEKRADQKIAEKAEKNAQIKERKGTDDINNIVPDVSGLSIYEAMQKKKEWLHPEEAVGKISGGFLYFYPPGIPLVVPGEVISKELVLQAEHIKERNGYLIGTSEEGELCVLKNDREEEN